MQLLRFVGLASLLAAAAPLELGREPASLPAGAQANTQVGGQRGIWISPEELMLRPTTGAAWINLVNWAGGQCATPDLSNQDDITNACVLAKALVAVRAGEPRYRLDVVTALRSIAASGIYSGRALALGRELPAYVIAADLIDLKTFDPVVDGQFRGKIRELLTTPMSGGPSNLIECHEVRPNNWGTLCGAARIAVAAYLGDQAQIERAAAIFKGYLGDRSTYAGFVFRTGFGQMAQTWSPDAANLVPINPKGATVVWKGNRYNVDGALIDDISRGCTRFQWPPCHTQYPWEGLAGAIVQAEILNRLGYPVYEWQDQALRRAYEYLLFLHTSTGGYWFDEGTTVGDDNWQPWIVNLRYQIALPAQTPTRPGKVMGFADWTHGPELTELGSERPRK